MEPAFKELLDRVRASTVEGVAVTPLASRAVAGQCKRHSIRTEGDQTWDDLLAGAPRDLVGFGKVQVYGAAMPEPQGQGGPAGEMVAIRSTSQAGNTGGSRYLHLLSKAVSTVLVFQRRRCSLEL